MILKLILIFITLPLLDLLILLKIANLIGLAETIAIVILTGIIGAGLAKKEGTTTLKKARTKLSHGKKISQELTNGLFIIIGAAFLVTPGLITDTIGFSFIIPTSRRFFKKITKKYLSNKIITTRIKYDDFVEN